MKMDEYTNVKKVITHIKKNVIFACPMDRLGAHSKVMSCKDISAALFANISDYNVGNPSYFSAD